MISTVYVPYGKVVEDSGQTSSPWLNPPSMGLASIWSNFVIEPSGEKSRMIRSSPGDAVPYTNSGSPSVYNRLFVEAVRSWAYAVPHVSASSITISTLYIVILYFTAIDIVFGRGTLFPNYRLSPGAALRGTSQALPIAPRLDVSGIYRHVDHLVVYLDLEEYLLPYVGRFSCVDAFAKYPLECGKRDLD